VYALVCLLAFRRPQSAEAALKYLVLSGAASATFPARRVVPIRGERLARARRIHGCLRVRPTSWRSPLVALVDHRLLPESRGGAVSTPGRRTRYEAASIPGVDAA